MALPEIADAMPEQIAPQSSALVAPGHPQAMDDQVAGSDDRPPRGFGRGVFDEDLASGYVRVLLEMTAAGWSSEALGKEMREIYGAWTELLTSVARRAEERGASLGGFTAEEIAALVSTSFVGAETWILLNLESERIPLRAALRKVGDLIRVAEEGRDS